MRNKGEEVLRYFEEEVLEVLEDMGVRVIMYRNRPFVFLPDIRRCCNVSREGFRVLLARHGGVRTVKFGYLYFGRAEDVVDVLESSGRLP